MGILTTINFVNYSSFAKDIELENSAHEVALAIREIQSAGINKKTRDGYNLNNLIDIKDSFGENYGYGVYFSKLVASDWDSKQFIFYRDENSGTKANNKIFDKDVCSGLKECYSRVKIGKDNFISKITTEHAEEDGVGDSGIDEIHIHFQRPEPDADILVGTDFNVLNNRNKVTIELSNSVGSIYCIDVSVAGNVSVNNCYD